MNDARVLTSCRFRVITRVLSVVNLWNRVFYRPRYWTQNPRVSFISVDGFDSFHQVFGEFFFSGQPSPPSLTVLPSLYQLSI